MKVDPLSLALALVLLWTPIMVFVRQSMRDRLKNPIRNRSATIGRMLLTPLNWIDMARAAGGFWVLRELAITIEPGVTGVGTLVLMVYAGVLAIGVLFQTIWHDEELIIIGPLFYIAGATVLLVSWQVGLFSILLGVTLAQMLSRLSWMFTLVPLLFVVFAKLFSGLGVSLALAAGLYLLPLLLAIGAQTPVALMHSRSALDRVRVPHARM
ncbi:MAG TPA: hypothetical protein VIK52_07590 [Opitutaceae bacterium]